MRAVLLEAPEMDARGHMALDEALLDAGGPGALILRFFRWKSAPGSPPAATFGYFQRYKDVEESARRLGPERPFELVRRLTGGGLVHHDGDITFSLVFPWGRLESASWVYKNLHRGVHLGLKSRGLKAHLWSPSSKSPAPSLACFAAPVAMDLVREDGSKCLGGALRRRNGVGLYQGSLRPEGFQASREALVQAIEKGIGQEWGVSFRKEAAGEAVLSAAARLREERYGSDEWNRRR